MALKISQFLAILLTALAMIPGGAHVLALSTKIALPQEPYFIVQQIYREWAWLGIVVVAAMLANLANAILTRGQSRPFWLATAAFVLIAATLMIFFIWTFPANQVTGNWTTVPENWQGLRAQWEYSHAANAGLTFTALICSILAAFSTTPQTVVVGEVAVSTSVSASRRS